MNTEASPMWKEYRRWWPFFAVGIVVGALVGFAIGRSGDGNGSRPSHATAVRSNDADSERQFEHMLSRQGELIAEGKYAEAYDFLLAAARLSPSDPRLLSAVFGFIEQAAGSDDADASVLAEDLYARADMLIPYQSVDSISLARK